MHEIAISEADTIIVDPIHFEKKKKLYCLFRRDINSIFSAHTMNQVCFHIYGICLHTSSTVRMIRTDFIHLPNGLYHF